MIVYLLFHNREAVARMICQGSPDAVTGDQSSSNPTGVLLASACFPYVSSSGVSGYSICWLAGSDLVIPDSRPASPASPSSSFWTGWGRGS